MERHWSAGFVFLFLVPCHLKFNFRGISFLTFDPGPSLCFQAPLESCWESQTLCFAGHGFSMNLDMGGESASQQVQLDEIKCRMVELPHEEAEKAHHGIRRWGKSEGLKGCPWKAVGARWGEVFFRNVSLPGERRNKYLFLNKLYYVAWTILLIKMRLKLWLEIPLRIFTN